MITRIVKMTFQADKVADFIEIFENSKTVISNFEGCKSLRLLNDINNQNTFFTYSIWESEQHLDAYRNSDVFKAIWKKTKVLFTEKAQAWSTSEYSK